MHCPRGNATDPIWWVLASSDGISSWTLLKSQHSNPNPNRSANQLWCIDFLTPLTSHHPSQTPCLPWISYATQKLMLDSCKMVEKQSEAFHTFLWQFFSSLKQNFIAYRSSKVSSQIALLTFTSCDNQALVGCIPIAAVACSFEPEIIKIGQSSHTMYSNNIVNAQESTPILNACTKKKSCNLLNAPRIIIIIFLVSFYNSFSSNFLNISTIVKKVLVPWLGNRKRTITTTFMIIFSLLFLFYFFPIIIYSFGSFSYHR